MIYPVEDKECEVVPVGRISLSIDDILFKYEDRTVLENLSFEVEQGECVSIIGASGAGKSTLVNILLGFEQPLQGGVKLAGIDLDRINRKWLRKNVICVPQSVILRSASILDNILFNMKDVSDEQIQKALEVACLNEWIELLPQGLNTFIGEQSLKISGGEKQRICIARAILRQPRILILDEATSALDSITEKEIVTNLKNYLVNTTLIFVTHRMSLLSLANKVVRIGNNFE